MIARPTRSQCRPVAGLCQKRSFLNNKLVFKDVHAAEQIVFRLQNCFAWIMLRQMLVCVPIEVASVTFRVLVGELEQAFAAHHAMTDPVDNGYLRLGVPYV